jgi:predicted RNA-binding protein YlxR (DUF448 family)
MRQCAACRRRRPQAELLRLHVGPDGALVLTEDRRRTGRGAYVCPREQCQRAAVAKRLFGRSLRAPVKIENEASLLAAMRVRGADLQTAIEVSNDGEDHR